MVAQAVKCQLLAHGLFRGALCYAPFFIWTMPLYTLGVALKGTATRMEKAALLVTIAASPFDLRTLWMATVILCLIAGRAKLNRAEGGALILFGALFTILMWLWTVIHLGLTMLG